MVELEIQLIVERVAKKVTVVCRLFRGRGTELFKVVKVIILVVKELVLYKENFVVPGIVEKT